MAATLDYQQPQRRRIRPLWLFLSAVIVALLLAGVIIPAIITTDHGYTHRSAPSPARRTGFYDTTPLATQQDSKVR